MYAEDNILQDSPRPLLWNLSNCQSQSTIMKLAIMEIITKKDQMQKSSLQFHFKVYIIHYLKFHVTLNFIVISLMLKSPLSIICHLSFHFNFGSNYAFCDMIIKIGFDILSKIMCTQLKNVMFNLIKLFNFNIGIHRLPYQVFRIANENVSSHILLYILMYTCALLFILNWV